VILAKCTAVARIIEALGVPRSATVSLVDISNHKEVDIVAVFFRKPALTLDDSDSACIVGAEIEIKVIFTKI